MSNTFFKGGEKFYEGALPSLVAGLHTSIVLFPTNQPTLFQPLVKVNV